MGSKNFGTSADHQLRPPDRSTVRPPPFSFIFYFSFLVVSTKVESLSLRRGSRICISIQNLDQYAEE